MRVNKLTDKKFTDTILKIKFIAFDFDGVFTDNKVHVQENGVEFVTCNRSDGLGLQKIWSLGIKTCIVSTESNPVVSARSKKLKIECFQNIHNKKQCIEEICQTYGIHSSELAFVGNDINDIPAFQIAGLRIGVSDCHSDIIPFIDCLTEKPGGRGAVREICDYFAKLKAKNK